MQSTTSSTSHPDQLHTFRKRFEDFVGAEKFPCVGARAAVAQHRARFALYGGLGDACSAARLCKDLEEFSAAYPDPGEVPTSFIAMFDGTLATEAEFESRMWCHLQQVHMRDREAFEWDPTVSDDPDDAEFSFSVAGRAFFVVGLSPASSRIARRAPMPCLVFNFHDQFENLRASGKYASYQRVIRERDRKLQGGINPALAVFGEQSEARQYAGRMPEPGWRCPLHTGARNAR